MYGIVKEKAVKCMAYRNLIDWEKYLAEDQEIELLTDPSEAAKRERMLEEINKKVSDYNAHINAYNYTQHCKSIEARGLIFKPISKKRLQGNGMLSLPSKFHRKRNEKYITATSNGICSATRKLKH